MSDYSAFVVWRQRAKRVFRRWCQWINYCRELLQTVRSFLASAAGLADGTVIGTAGKNLSESKQTDPIVARAVSKRYGPVATIKTIRHGAIANHDDLRRIGIVFTAIAAIVIILFAIFVRRWQSNDPLTVVQSALISDELVPYYQPIVDINSGKLLGAENHKCMLPLTSLPNTSVTRPLSMTSVPSSRRRKSGSRKSDKCQRASCSENLHDRPPQ